MSKAYLVLENGSIYEGQSFGSETEAAGEVVFNTGMIGYHDTLTDKSYFGQIVVQTFPLIGNYGIINDNFEGEQVIPSAYVVKEYCCSPSNFRCEGKIDDFLKEKGVPGICGIDTRALTKEIRENGVMNGKLVHSKEAALAVLSSGELKDCKIENAASKLSTDKQVVYAPKGEAKAKAAIIDLGCKKSYISALTERGIETVLCPANTSAEEIKALGVQGVMISNGAGDPNEYKDIIANVKAISELGLPVLAIGKGHEVLSVASGFTVSKMKFGHRGANQPVKDISKDRVYITSQNHGYGVVAESVDADKAEVRFVNVNDGSCEGIVYKNIDAVSVQFNPDAFGGPLDTSWIIDEFAEKMGGRK